jgi:hypothetical protein
MTSFYKNNKEKVDARYKKVQAMMNMSADEMRDLKTDPCSKKASIKRLEVINRCIRILETPKEHWTQRHWFEAGKIISYISRASQIQASKPVSRDCPLTKNDYALINWAYDPRKEKGKNKMAKKTAKKKTAKKVAKKKTAKKVAKKKAKKSASKRK